MDKVSVIVPVYRPEIPLLKRALNSVLQQTWQNLELLLVLDDPEWDSRQVYEILSDDLETDENLTKESARLEHERYMNSRLRILHTEGSTGVSAARNLGIDNAEGEWICFLDQDDYYDLSFVEQMITLVKSQGCEMAMSGFSLIDGDGNYVGGFPDNDQGSMDSAEQRQWLYWSTCAIWNRIYNRAALNREQIRFPEHCYTEDMLFVLQCNEHLNCSDVERGKLYYNYQNPQSTSRSKGFRQLSIEQMPWDQLEAAVESRDQSNDLYAVGFVLNELVLLTCIVTRASEKEVCHIAGKRARAVWLQLTHSVSELPIREAVTEYLQNAELDHAMKILMKGYFAALSCKLDRIYSSGVRKLLRMLR